VIIESHADALRFLDDRIGQGVKPGLERITGLLDFLADPHTQYPVIHVAGTNGKTTVVRLIEALLGAHGLRTGSFTSPHLHRVEERFQLDGSPIDADRFVAAMSDVAWPVTEYERRSGEGVTYFELTAALALSLFAAEAVDVAVIEVGMGGRWDATNAVTAAVSAITGISLDHTEHLGESLGEIAEEKAAIVKGGGVLVTGPLPAAAEGAVTAQVAATGSSWLRFGADFSVDEAVAAVGGWQVDVEGVRERYDGLYLPLHGRHQVDHLATAIAVSERFLERALDPELVIAATAAATAPGRLEVAGHRPIVVLDGAHNEEGLAGLAATLDGEFPALPWDLVVGARGSRDVAQLLEPLAGAIGRVWATAADDPSAIPAHEVAAAAGRTLGVPVQIVERVPDAVAAAMQEAGPGGAVVVTGSLYVVGEARGILVGEEVAPSGVHVRYEASVVDDDAFGEDDGDGEGAFDGDGAFEEDEWPE